MTKPPIFGAGDERWTLGSVVRVHYWQRLTEGGAKEIDGIVLVTGLRPDGEGDWVVTVTWGPLLDLKFPTEFAPAAVEWLP